MAQKTRSQLVTQSNNTFQDTPPENITPPNHRQFNDDFVDSAANVQDNNTFEGMNTFNSNVELNGATIQNSGSFTSQVTISSNVGVGVDAFYAVNGDFHTEEGTIKTDNGNLIVGNESTFNGRVYHNDQVVSSYAGATIASAATIDLTNVDGNLIFITGTTEINTITGNIGAIFYCTFVEGTTIVPSGISIQPEKSLSYNSGDTIIFVIQASNQIRILGRYRDGGAQSEQSFFVINYASFNLLQTNFVLQVGATYEITDVPNTTSWPGLDWRVRVLAIGVDTITSVGSAFVGGVWVKCFISANDVTTFKIYGTDSEYNNIVFTDLFDNYNTLSNELYGVASEIVATDPYGVNSRALVLGDLTLQKINLINLNELGINGRYQIDQANLQKRWFSHHYSSGEPIFKPYGNHPTFEGTPITTATIGTFNSNLSTGSTDFTSVAINYQIVNNLVTVHFAFSFTTRFNSLDCSHSCIVAVPLPFPFDGSNNADAAFGHGTLRFLPPNNCNRVDMGAIGKRKSGSDNYVALFTSKFSSTDSGTNEVEMVGTFTYIANPYSNS